MPQTDPSRPSSYAILPFDQGALIRFSCRTQLHHAVLPRDCIIQANNILSDADRAVYKNGTVCFRIRSLLRFRGISPQKAPSSDRMKQISRSTKIYRARIKIAVSICAVEADMMHHRKRHAVDLAENEYCKKPISKKPRKKACRRDRIPHEQ